MAIEYDAIRVQEQTKERVNREIPDDMTRDEFMNELLDQYTGEATADGSDQQDSSSVSNDDLQTEIRSLRETVESLGGRNY